MPKLKKLYKKYERPILIGLVVLLLATFSIGGALTNCEGDRRRSSARLGGTFEPIPGESMELDDDVFDARHAKFTMGQRALQMNTLEFRDKMMSAADPEPLHATWMHVLATEAARAAGYKVGDRQLQAAIKELVNFRMRGSGLPSSTAIYQQFLRNEFSHGTQSEFEDMVREIVRKDEFLAPLIKTALFDLSYDEAYKEWRTDRERVDLAYVSVPGAPFAEVVEREEATRTEISRQADLLKDLTTACRSVRQFVVRAEKAKAANGEYPKDMQGPGRGPFQLAGQEGPLGRSVPLHGRRRYPGRSKCRTGWRLRHDR